MLEEKKVASFLNEVDKNAYSLIKNLVYPDSPIRMNFDKIRQSLISHVKTVIIEAAERNTFHQIVRGQNETFREFILNLQTQAARCGFADQSNSQMRDRLITYFYAVISSVRMKRLDGCRES